MRIKIKSLSTWILAAGIGSVWLFPGYSLAQTSYYQGKTITIIRGGSPGGTGDNQVRALIPYLRKYIPGGPTIIIQNMPGAAGIKAINYIHSRAKPDGLKIGAVGAGLAAGGILGLPGVKYDVDKLIYLGSTDTAQPYIFVTRKEAGLDSVEKLRAASGIRIGAQTVGHPIYIGGRMIAYLLGLKDPRFVVGYGGRELDIAILRGEVDGRLNNANTIVTRNPEALKKGLIHPLVTITSPKGRFHPRFANIPDLDTFARNERERELVDLFRTFLYPRWPLFQAPGTPPELVKILREAIAKAFKDPGFHENFRKLMGNDATPLTGEELERAIREIPRDPDLLELYKKMAGHDPLPPR